MEVLNPGTSTRHVTAGCFGLRRRVTLQNTSDPADPGLGKATISDAYDLGLSPLSSAGWSATDRFLRYAKAGRTSDVTKFSGELGTDPGHC